MAYLDNTGLSYFWGKIKSALSAKQNKITASGPLQGDGSGNVTAAETTEAGTIPIPAGILKGTASGGLEAATPGTDYEEAAFTIHFTLSGSEIRSDKTGEQIVAAFNAGLRVEAFLDGKQLAVSSRVTNGYDYDFMDIDANGNIEGVRLFADNVTDVDTGATTTTYYFFYVQYSYLPKPNLNVPNSLYGVDEDGFWGLNSNISLSNLPAVTTDENGKTLRVIGGEWAISNAPVTSVNGATGAVTVREMPAVTASDNGKFLRVVNGAWAIAAVDNANGGVF